ncbi:MAG: hypothetical protein LPD71_07155 [Shewanella sp.]|nr:hypothetical protein [Shewanella sp.]MCF1431059.1 hypothetical protein [Shewanella sp.]MCF1438519.1 hypothetical protein [Shewanella sp.]MCF1457344.1 hypothetical protein [Shewanella sp.]
MADRPILEGKKAEDAFLNAILHDVGKITIFKILVNAFASAEEGEVPCSSLFRQVMIARSLLLSAMLSGGWNLS